MQRCNKNSFMKVAAMVMAMMAIPLAAKAQTACPIQPTQVKNIDSQLAIQFNNVSSKAIVGYRFALMFFDQGGKAHMFPHPLADGVRMMSRARRTSIWPTPLAKHFLYPYAQAFLQHVTFADGTSWADDGSHSCGVISVQE